MGEQNTVQLKDRVKELTYSTGTTNFALAGAAQGFSSFASNYPHNEVVFYAATDGTAYEVGSGVLLREDADAGDAINVDQLERYPFISSNNNGKINFGPGVKEVYVTYPATHSVIMGSGLPNLNVPKRKGIAVWDSENILNYYSAFTFNSSLSSLGINKDNSIYGLDLGGSAEEYYSRIRASGYFVGPTGVEYQSGNGNTALGLTKSPYTGGSQYVHFSPNLTDVGSPGGVQTNSHLVVEVSGDVNQYILFKKQDAHTIFAGPDDDCTPSCESDYPTFRSLVIKDLPMVALSGEFTGMDSLIATSGSLVSYTDSEILAASGDLYEHASGIQDNLTNHINQSNNDFEIFELATSGRVDTYLDNASGILYPVKATVVGKTIPTFSANEVKAVSFAVNGIDSNNNYTVVISPSGNLSGNIVLTHSFAAADNEVSGIFYAPTIVSSTQVMNFFISAHKM